MKIKSLFMNVSAVLIVLLLSGCATKTPLVEAAEMGNMQSVKNLIASGAPIDEISGDWNRYTPLVGAILQGKTEVAKFLLNEGADPNGANGYVPIVYASQKGNSEIVKMLIDAGADIEKKDFLTTALIQASIYGHTNVVKILLDAGAIVDSSSINYSKEHHHLKISKLLEAEQNKQLGISSRKTNNNQQYINADYQDITGWKDLKWGMTPEEINKILQPKEQCKVRLYVPRRDNEINKIRGTKYLCGFTLVPPINEFTSSEYKNISLAGMKVSYLHLSFDQYSKGLIGLSIGVDGDFRTYLSISNALYQKYGPSKRENNKYENSSWWYKKSGKIRLGKYKNSNKITIYYWANTTMNNL